MFIVVAGRASRVTQESKNKLKLKSNLPSTFSSAKDLKLIIYGNKFYGIGALYVTRQHICEFHNIPIRFKTDTTKHKSL